MKKKQSDKVNSNITSKNKKDKVSESNVLSKTVEVNKNTEDIKLEDFEKLNFNSKDSCVDSKNENELDSKSKMSYPKNKIELETEMNIPKNQLKLELIRNKPKNDLKLESTINDSKNELKVESKKNEPKNELELESKSNEPKMELELKSKSYEPKNELELESTINKTKNELELEFTINKPKNEFELGSKRNKAKNEFDLISKSYKLKNELELESIINEPKNELDLKSIVKEPIKIKSESLSKIVQGSDGVRINDANFFEKTQKEDKRSDEFSEENKLNDFFNKIKTDYNEDKNKSEAEISPQLNDNFTAHIKYSNYYTGNPYKKNLNNKIGEYRGLNNYANTCYLNSVIQILCHNEGLYSILKNKTFEDEFINKLQKVINGLRDKESQNFEKDFIEFLNLVNKLDNKFADGHQRDAKAFYLFILSNLFSNKELKNFGAIIINSKYKIKQFKCKIPKNTSNHNILFCYKPNSQSINFYNHLQETINKFFVKKEETSSFCEKCISFHQATEQKQFDLPNTICIYLSDWTNRISLENKNEVNIGGKKYILSSLIERSRTPQSYGHFFAICLESQKKWIVYDDSCKRNSDGYAYPYMMFFTN